MRQILIICVSRNHAVLLDNNYVIQPYKTLITNILICNVIALKLATVYAFVWIYLALKFVFGYIRFKPLPIVAHPHCFPPPNVLSLHGVFPFFLCLTLFLSVSLAFSLTLSFYHLSLSLSCNWITLKWFSATSLTHSFLLSLSLFALVLSSTIFSIIL